MDYFSKFKRKISVPKTQPTSAMQLAKFHKCWNYVHNIFFVEDKKTNLRIEQTDISNKIRTLVDLLVDEEARLDESTTETGACMEYFLKNGVLSVLVNLSEADYPIGMRGETIRTVASMINLLNDRFLVHNAVHKPTIKLLRTCIMDERQSELYHEDLVDLMYIICSKIHGFPALLNVFFHDKQWLTTPHRRAQGREAALPTIGEEEGDDRPLGDSPARNRPHSLATPPPTSPNTPHLSIKRPEYEFLLFSYLLKFVHREGRAGDFARTGLLFLVEMATGALGEFILESDFVTILAAGLGALYSQLPRKLVVTQVADGDPAHFLLASDNDPSSQPGGIGVELSSNPDFQTQLDSFQKLLEFCQDVLTRCPNTDISLALLRNVKKLFLQNILYPSLLECSDADGSTVAVVSYIDLILWTLQQDELVDLVMGFLMNGERAEDSSYLPGDPMPEDGFSLKDLIFSCLQSSSQPTVIATLKLLHTLITRHCRYSLKLLMLELDEPQSKGRAGDEVENGEEVAAGGVPATTATTIGHHLRELEMFFSLITSIDSTSAALDNSSYECYLRDAELAIEADFSHQHTPAAPQKAPTSRLEKRKSFKYGQRLDTLKPPVQVPQEESRIIPKHRLSSRDPLLKILQDSLSHYFAHSSELNLVLTGVITALAICPYRSLEGWLIFQESDRKGVDSYGEEDGKVHASDIYGRRPLTSETDYEDENEDEEREEGDMHTLENRGIANATAPAMFVSFPPFFTLLKTLTQQIEFYRSEVEGFDRYLEERRRGLLFGENWEEERREDPSGSPFSTTTASSTASSTVAQAQMAAAGMAGFLSPGKRVSNRLRSPSASRAGGKREDSPSFLSPQDPSASPHPVRSTLAPHSPLHQHARNTQRIRVKPLFPHRFVNPGEAEERILDLEEDDEDVFAPNRKKSDPENGHPKGIKEISLSNLLNNVVILEEAIKEIIAIVQVRRSLGIDEVRFA
ncbi:uncharacterized protein VTP21DRAFT_1739 [Calcarisporiella thermophila]|uniref:uncharacterized protein n=1 Tax=Calcarisporiella thermophila TaxID=911321 RepID=UPI0037446625